MHIENINHASEHLKTVKELGRANASTLGHLPEGAFDDYAKRGTILIALNDNQDCIGYLLFRISRDWATIVHLCVDTKFRGQRIARELIRRLCADTKDLIGIRADCRRDYPINKMWPKLGFYAVNERPGRSHSGSILDMWRLEHGHPDLFTQAMKERLETKLGIVIDANIFYDLYTPNGRHNEESLALLADWLKAEIEIMVSDELWNEINRGLDSNERQRARAFASQFSRVPYNHNAFQEAQESLRELFPTHMKPSDESDLRQLARAIAGEMQFFITRDAKLLDLAEEVYKRYGIAIRRPSDLIIHLDELRRQHEYQPARLAGTQIQLRRIHSQEQENLATHFQHNLQGESRSNFEHQLHCILATPTTIECWVALDSTEMPLLLFAIDRSQDNCFTLPLVRVRRGPLGPTLARYILLEMIARAAQEGRWFTRITDPALDNVLIDALQQNAFVQLANGAWEKIHLAIADNADTITATLHNYTNQNHSLTSLTQQFTDILGNAEMISNPVISAELERQFWPVKIIDSNIPIFLVPIQPYWAQELFDEDLANQTLFGATKLLMLNHEAVYYRSSQPRVLNAPGRILWYVSKDKQGGYQGGGAIRACSRLEEVIIELPKVLYRRFQRLGIYEWQHVFATANNKLDQPIMAIRFSHTELFHQPIPLSEIKSAYKDNNCGLVLQGPSRVSRELFTQFYRKGMNLS
jgi:predicted nucleic acid-binding protein/ribosomal protein S18 acetylase RimI-like enzyme